MTTSTVLMPADEELKESDILVAIPILSGGMVDVALRELGAKLVDVCYIDDAQPIFDPNVT